MANPLISQECRGPDEPMLLSEFRRVVAADPMTPAERCRILDQAQIIIKNFYAHMPQKRSLYGVDPCVQLELLARRQQGLADAAFHRELLGIFDALRDMHTTYVLPVPYRGRVLLGFAVECYWEKHRKRRFIVSKPGPAEYSAIPAGAEILHWNGMPIETAVRRNAESEAGGNAAARFARGLESLTLRNAALSPLPDEDWVHIRYRTGREIHSSAVSWMVEPDLEGLPPEIDATQGAAARKAGYSLRTEVTRLLKADRLRTAGDEQADWFFRTSRVRARVVHTASGDFGHLRIHSFHVPEADVKGFLEEMREVLRKMPRRGLIVDVRGNPGGHIEAAEGLLALLTERAVQPEPMQFANSPLTYDLCGRSGELVPWRQSIGDADETGAQHSAAIPLSVMPRPDRPYRGPVVLITDALTYSAADMFAAGFQDNRIGWVLGVDDNTGAGGANVWNVSLLRQVWPEGPVQELPRGSRLTFALRRSLRVGGSAGRPVEDLGVVPNVRYRMTRRDLTARNADLMDRAGRLLLQLTKDRAQARGSLLKRLFPPRAGG